MKTGAKVGIIIVSIIGGLLLIGRLWFVSRMNHMSDCEVMKNNLDHKRANLEGRQGSLGGSLDLDGSMASARNQFNLDVDYYNNKCASGQTTNST
jgi:hypothetical protein